MDLLAVSPENEYQGEVDLVIALLEGGLDRYHLRKPDWNRKKQLISYNPYRRDYRAEFLFTRVMN